MTSPTLSIKNHDQPQFYSVSEAGGFGTHAMLTYKHQNLLLNTRPDKDFSALVDHVKQAFGIPESSPISIFKKVDGKGMFQITDILSLNETQQFYATDSDAFEEG